MSFTPSASQSLFEGQESEQPQRAELLADGAMILRGFALPALSSILADLSLVVQRAPFRHMITPGGFEMSVGMTNCGERGWISDRRGYRYSTVDPQTSRPWPEQPRSFQLLATTAAATAGYADFHADACLVNRYSPGARLTLHQDKDELDRQAPIVSVSLGLPAVFQFGGLRRSDVLQRVNLWSGDVVVWGGPSRLAYHGVLALKDGNHPDTGACRLNLTFRKTGQ